VHTQPARLIAELAAERTFFDDRCDRVADLGAGARHRARGVF
jgi:hypothetical protein